jgi:hypothetical protein
METPDWPCMRRVYRPQLYYEAARAKAAGIDAVLLKPWQGREFALTLRRVLG